ncbi:MAG: hydantoinase/carbamoylase family amidase [Hyphomicrobiales bacterium]|nr:hydantoinase/carbamoylase family amidase [Hyphomicrobiales bacterium]
MSAPPAPDLDLAERLFTTLGERTRDTRGITRASYGEGEQFAHDLMAQTARAAGLETSSDAAGNLYVTLEGRDRSRGTFLIASHLDSVPQGGNFDGAAGVIAGMAIVTAWKRAGFRPAGDVAVMAIRAEESTWFPYSYIGSKAALGLLPKSALAIARADTGRSLAEHMRALGCDPDAVARGTTRWSKETIRGYVELHIEQGPVLTGQDIPVAIVTGIRGSFRYRDARMLGEYGHSGAVPRSYRHDAVVAAADLVVQLDRAWERLEREGHDLTVTVGKLFTDPAQHAFSKIAGEVGICIDVRSHSNPTLALMKTIADGLARDIEARYGVRFECGPLTGSEPATMDAGLIDTFSRAATAQDIAHIRMASGAGHDAAVFAGFGIPTAMIFVRNQNGSHNPDEAMRMEDFELATRVLAHGVAARD